MTFPLTLVKVLILLKCVEGTLDYVLETFVYLVG